MRRKVGTEIVLNPRSRWREAVIEGMNSRRTYFSILWVHRKETAQERRSGVRPVQHSFGVNAEQLATGVGGRARQGALHALERSGVGVQHWADFAAHSTSEPVQLAVPMCACTSSELKAKPSVKSGAVANASQV